MQRYFISLSSLSTGEEVFLNEEITHHMFNVMRNHLDDRIYLITSDRFVYEGRLTGKKEGKARVYIEKQIDVPNTELNVEVTIACGLSKNDKLDWIVQKATECGMSAFIPTILKRDVVKWPPKKVPQRLERLQKIAQEAAQQSYRLQIPSIKSPQTLKELTHQTDQYDHLIVAYEETAKKNEMNTLLKSHQSLKNGDRILIVFGSEGGFDPQEILQLQDSGFVTVGLGPRILRAETAPIYYLSTLSYVNDIMKLVL